jgi:hypothetical protein
MDRSAGLPLLLGSFERHLRAANRADTTVATYLIAARQAEAFLHARCKELPEANRSDLEAFMGDLRYRPTRAGQRHHSHRMNLYVRLADRPGRGPGSTPTSSSCASAPSP